MIEETEQEKLLSFAKNCLKLRSNLHLNTTTLTPINYQHEKEKFFASSRYNPQYHYKKRKKMLFLHDINNLQKELGGIKLPTDIKNYFLAYIDNISIVAKSISAIGTDRFPFFTDQLFAC